MDPTPQKHLASSNGSDIPSNSDSHHPNRTLKYLDPNSHGHRGPANVDDDDDDDDDDDEVVIVKNPPKKPAKEIAYENMLKDCQRIGLPAPGKDGRFPSNPIKIEPVEPVDNYIQGNVRSSNEEADDANPLGIDMGDGPDEFMSPQKAEEALRELVEGMYEGDMEGVDVDAAMPEGLSCKLLPHQIIGVNWMRSREEGKKKGGILADDMGFGKTVQSIALISSHKQITKGAPKTTLVVCPLALKDQWVEEVKQKSDLSVILYHGPKRHQIAHKLHKYRVVITTYDVVSSEWGEFRKKVEKDAVDSNGESDETSDSPLQKTKSAKKKRQKPEKPTPLFITEEGDQRKFWRIILDEAHTIKNRTSNKAKSCFDLSAVYKWCLTGTPIQNGIEDLYPLLRFIGPSMKPFYDYSEFNNRILKPMKGNRGKAAVVKIQALLKIILLRRSKDSKDKDGNPILQESEFYQSVADRMAERMEKLAQSGLMQKSYITILTLVLRMRQATLHPSLGCGAADASELEVTDPKTAPPSEDLEDKVDDLADLISDLRVKGAKCNICLEVLPAETADVLHCSTCERQLRVAKKFEGMHSSTKISRLLELLDEIALEQGTKNKKTIVFSQFTSFLDLIEPFIKKAGYGYTRFDGAKSADEKAEALRKIKSDSSCTVLLISLKCGSVGLNLTCCSRVVLMDPWWNPAIESQAFDRSHRFGQREDVKCYKLTIADTIEDRILKLQEDKQSIANQALGTEAAKKMNKLSVAEILYLFRGD
ncbi:SNF2 family N-terminal domain-domain-containing protein [Phakopsora pachyrhizi]|uniref:SNF2 family N-terminal domain-domain-containing protein n=1 Tax=Phakopsora pachyrhizi TaxID=170000 RepID=A0AAV0BFJ6_PHAPC|nr:SNF2 family N-terminal domain-domain-containing protein [Phakopsora pachyrhizi]CAH7684628.1 SNF2 family N-terminal domain-domain-containing protein [Phakopsora pachyrhizi]